MMDLNKIAKEYGYDHVSVSDLTGDGVRIYYLEFYPENSHVGETKMIGVPQMLVVGKDDFRIIPMNKLVKCGIKNLRVIDE